MWSSKAATLILLLLSLLCSTTAFHSAGFTENGCKDADINSLQATLKHFFLEAGDCTQTQFCNQGGYNLRQIQTGEGCAVTCSDSSTLMTTLLPNGTWPDVNYEDRTLSLWQTIAHLERTLSMARSYSCPKCITLYHNERLLAAAVSAFNTWLNKDFENPNWWWNDIGTPQLVGEIGILLGTTPTTLPLINTIMNRAKNGSGSGENLIWTQQVAINREILNCNPDVTKLIFDAMWSSVQVEPGSDGIQEDFSFHFHGPLLYTGGYGGDFALNLIVLANATLGTSFACPAGPFQLLSSYMLDSQQHVTFIAFNGTNTKSYFDINVKGREITRPPDGNLLFPNIYAKLLTDMGSNKQIPRANEYLRWGKALEGNGTPLEFSSFYYNSDYGSFQSEKYFGSVKMFSKRMFNNEVTNGEGIMSWHTGSGALLTYRRGDEYRGIFPVWDWTKIPGVTARHDVNEDPNKVKQYGPTTFVGGTSLDLISGEGMTVAMMDFESPDFGGKGEDKHPVTAKKSYFFVESGVIAVVSNVTLDYPSNVTTTLNQRLKAGSGVTGESFKGTLPDGTHRLANDSYLVHEDYVYASVYGDAPFVVTVGTSEGSWSRISETGNATNVTACTVTIEGDHGFAPSGDTYAYAILPGFMEGQSGPVKPLLEEYFKIFHLDDALPNAHFVSYRPDSASSLWVAAATVWDAPATSGNITYQDPGVFVTQQQAKVFSITAANPSQEAVNMTVVLQHTQLGSGPPGPVICQYDNATNETTVTVNVPTGGKSVSGTCPRVTSY